MTDNGNNNLSIARIEAESFLMIQKMDYAPREGVNLFAGFNSQAKTDIIRLLKAVFKGAGAECITHGKDKSSIMVRLSDGHEIKRAITEKSKRFQVKTPEGDFKASPQAYLDALLGDSDLSFDPIMFVLKDPKEQKQMLLETFNIGKIDPNLLIDVVEPEVFARLDFEKDGLAVLKDAENIYYTKRTDINKDVTKRKAFYEEAITKIKDYDPAQGKGDGALSLETSITMLTQQLSDAKATIAQAEKNKALIASLNTEMEAAEKEMKEQSLLTSEQIEKLLVDKESIIEQIKQLTKRMEEINFTIDSHQSLMLRRNELISTIKKNASTLNSLSVEIPDIASIEASLTTAKDNLRIQHEQRDKYADYRRAELLKAEYEAIKGESDILTVTIDKLRKELPETITKSVNIPFESLTFDNDEVVINGNRLSLMSTSEQLFFTLELYKERNKKAKLKIICCDHIESLDNTSYEKFWKWCLENKFQAFVTRVIPATMPEDAVYIEGGAIK